MALISKRAYLEKLKKNNIKVITKYKVGNEIISCDNEKINEDVVSGIVLEKEYYKNGYFLGKIFDFDSSIEYTMVNPKLRDKECPNCGMKMSVDEYETNCPYCHTYYNLDFKEKALGNKSSYNYVVHSKMYRFVALLIDILIAFPLVFFYIKNTSRTFNEYDLLKIGVFTTLLVIILYLVFYIVDFYIVLGPLKRRKAMENIKIKEFWNKTRIDKIKFFNNVIYELENYYFTDNFKDLIDFDIIDYSDFRLEKNEKQEIVYVNILIRFINLKRNKIKEKYVKKEYKFRRANKDNIENNDSTVIMCRNCGASLDITKHECDYCGTKYNYLQEWYLEK